MKRTDNALLVSVNWLGDAIMALPALDLWRQSHPDCRLSVLTKPPLAEFWDGIPAVRSVLTLEPGAAGIRKAARSMAAGRFDIAWILPNSFRSALVPWLAGIPRRRGLSGHCRRALLTEVASPSGRSCAIAGPRHQVWETLAILGFPPGELNPPKVPVDASSLQNVLSRFDLDSVRPLTGVFPGAARGPAKRWPRDYLCEALRQTRLRFPEMRICLLGSAAEAGLCAETEASLGGDVLNLAGKTGLKALAAVLARCDAVLCNDSGGMHLAVAVGAPTVAIFGLTDPEVTGPLGPGHIVLRPPSVRSGRGVPRRSVAALAALRQIRPEVAAAALIQLLAHRRRA